MNTSPALTIEVSLTRRSSDRSGSVASARRSSRAARAAAVAAAAVAALVFGSAPAGADSCPNAALRAQNNSSELSDCRAYELVTSPFKQGFAPSAVEYTDSGAVGYGASGVFAGNELGSVVNKYVATRSALGWLTTAPMPSIASNGEGQAFASSGYGGAVAEASDLRSSVWLLRRADESTEVQDFYLRRPDGTLTRIGPVVDPASLPQGSTGTAVVGLVPLVEAASADLTHLIYRPFSGGFPDDPSGGNSSLLEYVGTGNDRPRPVGVDNAGHEVAPGSACSGSSVSRYHATSTDGRVIFFTPGCVLPGAMTQVWARVNGATSIDASASLCTRASSDPGGVCNAPASATFQGANADGSRVYFTTTQQLVNGDTDQSNDLYACDIPPGTPAPIGPANPCASLSEVSGATAGADVEGVVRISDDGSRVYFVATGVLAANHAANGQAAVNDDHNLYVWEKDAAHPSGQATFVAKLDPNDSPLWGIEAGSAARMAQSTDDGRYLVLSTLSPLTNSGPSADTDGAADVYRYDAMTGTVVRLSTGADGDGGNEPGLDANMTSASYDAANSSQRARIAMTSDAGTVVFQTSEALSDRDTNGTRDVYAWHDGRVFLISSGKPAIRFPNGAVPFAGITASGADIFFNAVEKLTPADGDTNIDIYDARAMGGFDFTRPAPCSGDQCQGALAHEPDAPGSASDKTAGGSEDAPLPTATFSLQKVTAAARKKLESSGRITLRVSVNTSATVTARGTAVIARELRGVASVRRVVGVAGTVSLPLTLSKAARAQLKADGRLTVKIAVTNSGVAASQSLTLKLTHAKAKRTSRHKATGTSSVDHAAGAATGGES